jgi:4-hydroxy-tetrahydrodipicolinate synthase
MVATAFTPDAAGLDDRSQARLVRHLVSEGCTTLGLFGPIAEAETLTPGERERILEVVLRTAPGVPVALTIDPRYPSASSPRGYAPGGLPAGSMIVLPSAWPTASELADQARRLRRATGLDVAVEDRPGAGRHALPLPELVRAVREGGIVAVKQESPVTVDRIRALRAETSSVVLAGNGGALALDELLAGAQGLVAGISHTTAIVELVRAWHRGDVAGAARIHAGVSALIAFETHSARSVGIRKEAWRRRGLLTSSAVRRPGAGWLPALGPHVAMHEALGALSK